MRELEAEYAMWLREPVHLVKFKKYDENKPVDYENIRKLGINDVLDFDADEVV